MYASERWILAKQTLYSLAISSNLQLNLSILRDPY